MELWIRSQDKTKLAKVNSLWIMDNQIWMEVPFYENHKKLGLTVSGCNHKLATYTTKERAIEVLDEIATCIIDKELSHVCSNLLTLVNKSNLKDAKEIIDRIEKIAVYQMPKD